MTTLENAHDRNVGPVSQSGSVASTHDKAVRYALGGARILIGWTFLWAFLDKLFALGYATGSNPETGAVDRFGPDAWIHDGSPTYGFLTFAADGPFADFYRSIAGEAWTDWAFMLGLAAIGLSYALGIFMRLATVGGVAMYVLMWTVVLPPENNPFTDEHLIGAALVLLLGLLSAGRYIGLGGWWERLPFVQKHGVLV